jgi:hypothetical protein
LAAACFTVCFFFADAQSLKVIPSTQFTTNSYGQLGMLTDNANTLINFGTKAAFFNSNTTKQLTTSNINTSNLCVGSNIALTGSNFTFKETDASAKIHAWTFSSNTISKSNNRLSSLSFSTNNYWIVGSGSLEFQGRIQANNALVSDNLISFQNGEVKFDATNLKTKYTKYNSNYTSSNKSSYLYQYEDALEYKTQTSQAEWGSVAPQVLQFSCQLKEWDCLCQVKYTDATTGTHKGYENGRLGYTLYGRQTKIDARCYAVHTVEQHHRKCVDVLKLKWSLSAEEEQDYWSNIAIAEEFQPP